jgi:chorismate mutase
VYNKTLYRNEPLWEIPIELHRRMPDLPILNDPSHISGDRKLLLEVAQQALDLGFVNGFMIESHPNPDQAWSDAKQQLTPQALAKMMCELQTRDQSSENPDFEHALSAFRTQIDALDAQLLDILAERMQVVREIGRQKQAHNISILQIERWKQIFNSRTAQAEPKNLSVLFIAELLQAIHKESISQQTVLIKTLAGLLSN